MKEEKCTLLIKDERGKIQSVNYGWRVKMHIVN